MRQWSDNEGAIQILKQQAGSTKQQVGSHTDQFGKSAFIGSVNVLIAACTRTTHSQAATRRARGQTVNFELAFCPLSLDELQTVADLSHLVGTDDSSSPEGACVGNAAGDVLLPHPLVVPEVAEDETECRQRRGRCGPICSSRERQSDDQ